MLSPVDHISADADLVRALLAGQHPDLADLPLIEVEPGWDNTLWRAGDELVVRLPRRSLAAALTLTEQRCLPVLARHLPLPVPAPVRVGHPTVDFPWPWSVVPWFEGCPGDRAEVIDAEDAARRLGRVLRALHQEAPADAPYNPYRGVPLADRSAAFGQLSGRLAGEVDVDGAREVWDRAVGAKPWDRPRVWVHGDLHPANTLFVDGTLAAVIDFGDLCAGDPATDLAGAWLLLPTSALPTFSQAYGGVDAELGRRCRGWAVLFALMLIAIGNDGSLSYGRVGRAGLERLLTTDAFPSGGRG